MRFRDWRCLRARARRPRGERHGNRNGTNCGLGLRPSKLALPKEKAPESPQGPCIAEVSDHLAADAAGATSLASCFFFSACFLCSGFDAAGAGAVAAAGAAVMSAGLAAAGAWANETAAKAVSAAATSKFLFMFGIPVQSALALAPSWVSGLGIYRAGIHNATRSRSVYTGLERVGWAAAGLAGTDLSFLRSTKVNVTDVAERRVTTRRVVELVEEGKSRSSIQAQKRGHRVSCPALWCGPHCDTCRIADQKSASSITRYLALPAARWSMASLTRLMGKCST